MGEIFRPGALAFDDEDAVARYYEDEIGDGGIGDEIFFACELAVVRRELDVARIPAGVGFEDGDGGAIFASADGREIFLFVRRGGDGVEHGTGQYYGGKKRAGQERAAGLFH